MRTMVPSATAVDIPWRLSPARPRSAAVAVPPREARYVATSIPPMCPAPGPSGPRRMGYVQNWPPDPRRNKGTLPRDTPVKEPGNPLQQAKRPRSAGKEPPGVPGQPGQEVPRQRFYKEPRQHDKSVIASFLGSSNASGGSDANGEMAPVRHNGRLERCEEPGPFRLRWDAGLAGSRPASCCGPPQR